MDKGFCVNEYIEYLAYIIVNIISQICLINLDILHIYNSVNLNLSQCLQ